MNILKNNLKKFLLALIIVVTVLNFAMVPRAHAFEWPDVGGMLYSLIRSLVNLGSDVAVNMLQSFMLGEKWSDIMVEYEVAKNKGIFEHDEKFLTKRKSELKATILESNMNHPDILDNNPDVPNRFPYISYTPETIFSGKVPMLSVNFISGKYYDDNGKEIENPDESWIGIRKTISNWYKVVRMLAIIALLSILIYTGIKIIISSNARDKAKYKEWIMNWFMAVAILFTMHYLMGFILSITGEISNLLADACGEVKIGWANNVDSSCTNEQNGKADVAITTNLMGYARWMSEDKSPSKSIGFLIIYIMLIVMTYKFTFIYLKRVLSMAFLTIIAPLVAFMYPIDKMNDGNAQAFDMWFKEYLFNALLQPMHLLLYYVILGSAVEIAVTNPLYGVVALMFLTEAEKMFKKIFGFEKASGGTVGGFAGGVAAGATAAALASGVKNVAGMLKGGNGGKTPGGNGGGNGGAGAPSDNPALDDAKPTTSTDEEMQSFMDNGNEEPPEALGDGRSDNSESAGGGDGSSEEEYDPYADLNMAPDEMGRDGDHQLDDDDSDFSQPDMSEEEMRQKLADSGMEGEELEDAMQQLGYGGTDDSAPKGVNTEPIHNLAAKTPSRFRAGMGAIGKRIVKPVWDLDKSKKQNFKRLGINAVKGLGKFAKITSGVVVGSAATIIQAGISMTDGKYNPLEGLATFTGGFAAGSGIVGGIGNKIAGAAGGIIDTYRQGADSVDRGPVMDRALNTFRNDDKVIEFNKKNYKPEEQKTIMQREQNLIKNNGIKDLKDQKKCFKYTAAQMKDWEAAQKGKGVNVTDEMRQQQQAKFDQKSAATLNFQNRLKDQGQLGAVHDKKKRDAYIDTMIQQEAGGDAKKAEQVRTKYNNAFNSVVAFQDANK